MLVLVVFSVVLAAGSFCEGQIVFLQEPKNVTVSEGLNAFFACTYNGTSRVPVWRIANEVFVTSALPPRHSYNGFGLVVSRVELSLNMTSYSCFFSVYIGGGEFMDIESTTGYLIIAASASLTSMHFKYSTSPRYTRPTVLYDSATVFIEPTITISKMQQSFDTLDGRAQPVATESVIPLTPIPLNLPLVIGIVAGVGISLLIITAISTLLCIMRQTGHTLTKSGNDVTSATQKQVPINMKENVAYEVPSSRIKMTENKSYSTLPTVNRP